MNLKKIRMLLLFLTVVFANVWLLSEINGKLLQIRCFSYPLAYENLRKHEISEEIQTRFFEASDFRADAYSELLTMYFSSDGKVTDTEILQKDIAFVKKYRAEDFSRIQNYVYAIWSPLECFPVGAVTGEEDAGFTFSDSWMQSRTF
ncbi:MAG: M23 family peptidase, partial [Clostridiales bacterium]|nr:M23 family peptidase [Clostridiales bacterium]